jgi:thioredoxin reductase
VRVFGKPLGAWRDNMPEGMLLKSAPSASSISAPSGASTLARYLEAHDQPPLYDFEVVSRELFVRYGLWFAQRHVPDVEDVHVTRLSRAGTAFDVELSTGEEFRARRVIIASGFIPFPYIAPGLRSLPPDLVSHSSQHVDVTQLASRRVAIVGAGQSALELSVLVHEAGGEPILVARAPQLIWGTPPDRDVRRVDPFRKPNSPLGPGYSLFAVSTGAGFIRYLPASTRLALVKSILGPSGGWWLRERFEGRVNARLGCAIHHAIPDDNSVTLELTSMHGGSEKLEVDHVVAATGYRVDLEKLAFLDRDLLRSIRRVSGSPALRPTFESSVPGLYFVGQAAAATFGPLMRFVAGTNFAAARVTAAVTRSTRQPMYSM